MKPQRASVFLIGDASTVLHRVRKETLEERIQLIEALESMYDQYCSDGHSFMSAGEHAEVVLQRYGFIFDRAGRMKSRPDLSATLEAIKKLES